MAYMAYTDKQMHRTHTHLSYAIEIETVRRKRSATLANRNCKEVRRTIHDIESVVRRREVKWKKSCPFPPFRHDRFVENLNVF